MDGKLLWNTLYSTVVAAARRMPSAAPRRGHPDTYSLEAIALCWLWAAVHNRPLMRTASELRDPQAVTGWLMRGYQMPTTCPHETTLRRRAQRGDFQAFLQRIRHRVLKRLRPDTRCLIIDSSLFSISPHSRDADARWGHHGLRGYRWHTLITREGVIVESQVESANEHELKVARMLVERAHAQGIRCRMMIADEGYDSERLHAQVRTQLRGRLIAPLNDRGGRRAMRRTPHRRWLNERWNSARIQSAMRVRPAVERMYSLLKSCEFGLFALVPCVRGLPNVRRWIELKHLAYHAYLLNR